MDYTISVSSIMETLIIFLIAAVSAFALIFLIAFAIKRCERVFHVHEIKKSHQDPSFIEEKIGKIITINPREYIKKYNLNENVPTVSRDSIKCSAKYFDGKYIYKGTNGNLNQAHQSQIEEIVRLFFKINDSEFVKSKAEALINAKRDRSDGTLHIDLYNFLINPKYYVFMFHETEDLVSKDIAYFCSSRASFFKKLPDTKYCQEHNNFVALFSKETTDRNDMRLLFYLFVRKLYRDDWRIINSITQYSTAQNGLLKDDGSIDFCWEEFYKIMADSRHNCLFPIKEIEAEMIARVSNYETWPKTYKLTTQLNMLRWEMYVHGVWKPRYCSEMDFFTFVHEHYPDAIFQYQDEWLGRQSLDVYIPSKHVAIEYQGQQHYRSVNLFGGKRGLEATKERDSKKAELCLRNNIKLYEWPIDKELTKEHLDELFM